MAKPLTHLMPEGAIPRGHDRFLCGQSVYGWLGRALVRDPAMQAEGIADATCRTCVAAAQLQREARGWDGVAGDE